METATSRAVTGGVEAGYIRHRAPLGVPAAVHPGASGSLRHWPGRPGGPGVISRPQRRSQGHLPGAVDRGRPRTEAAPRLRRLLLLCGANQEASGPAKHMSPSTTRCRESGQLPFTGGSPWHTVPHRSTNRFIALSGRDHRETPCARALFTIQNWSNNAYNLVTKGPRRVSQLGVDRDGNIGSKVHYDSGGLDDRRARQGRSARWRSPAKTSTRTRAPRCCTWRRPRRATRPSRWPGGGGRTLLPWPVQVNIAWVAVQREMRCAAGGYGQPRHLPYADICEDDVTMGHEPPCSRSARTSCLPDELRADRGRGDGDGGARLSSSRSPRSADGVRAELNRLKRAHENELRLLAVPSCHGRR